MGNHLRKVRPSEIRLDFNNVIDYYNHAIQVNNSDAYIKMRQKIHNIVNKYKQLEIDVSRYPNNMKRTTRIFPEKCGVIEPYVMISIFYQLTSDEDYLLYFTLLPGINRQAHIIINKNETLSEYDETDYPLLGEVIYDCNTVQANYHSPVYN